MQRNRLIALVILIAATAAVWIATHGEVDQANDPAFSTHWKCSKCDHTFELLPNERAEALKLKGSPPILCPACAGQFAYQVSGCPTCGTLYFGAEVPGASGFCPVCHPKKRQPDPEPEVPGEIRRPVANRN
ncbi:MAG: hypothetical protein H6819_07130 [Phycisphaerales bacterium]|nr:hypothetical protein [Phycisphaerales bacterium]MCB9857733.1 hypothetical protein [Phycisphaerales bacterium]MCB9863793.1 hypothetical protein [Phycisphaerales bacterium]